MSAFAQSEIDWSALDGDPVPTPPKPTPAMFPERKPTVLNRYEGHVRACYICAQATDCRLSVHPDSKPMYQMPLCQDCAKMHGIWVPPQP